MTELFYQQVISCPQVFHSRNRWRLHRAMPS